MINLVLILPIIFCIVLFVLKNQKANNICIVLYSIIHALLGIFYFLNPSVLLPNQYFSLNSSNIVFYIVLSIVYLAVAFYNIPYSKNMEFDNKKMTRYSIMTLIFTMAMTGGILADNLGLAWIFIEGTTLASAYLIYFNKTKHTIEAAWKYVFICSIGIALAFVGIILLTVAQGNLNTLNYSELYLHAKNYNHFWLNIAFVFILFGMGTKMGLAPVHFWLPDAHAQAPSSISALLSATLLNCAFLVILNVYKVMLFANCVYFAKLMLLAMGVLSLFVTSVFLYHTTNYKRMLAYSSIENMGIIAIAASLGGGAYFAMMIHLIGHSLIKASYFLTAGNILEIFQSKKIKSVRALGHVDKKTSWLWIVSCLGICAFPPSLLFISEFLIAKELIVQKKYVLCIIFLFLLTIILFAMARVVFAMLFDDKNEERFERAKKNMPKMSTLMYVPQAVLLTLAFALGLYLPKFLQEIIRNTIVG